LVKQLSVLHENDFGVSAMFHERSEHLRRTPVQVSREKNIKFRAFRIESCCKIILGNTNRFTVVTTSVATTMLGNYGYSE